MLSFSTKLWDVALHIWLFRPFPFAPWFGISYGYRNRSRPCCPVARTLCLGLTFGWLCIDLNIDKWRSAADRERLLTLTSRHPGPGRPRCPR